MERDCSGIIANMAKVATNRKAQAANSIWQGITRDIEQHCAAYSKEHPNAAIADMMLNFTQAQNYKACLASIYRDENDTNAIAERYTGTVKCEELPVSTKQEDLFAQLVTTIGQLPPIPVVRKMAIAAAKQAVIKGVRSHCSNVKAQNPQAILDDYTKLYTDATNYDLALTLLGMTRKDIENIAGAYIRGRR